MDEFESELRHELKRNFGVKDSVARRIAEQASQAIAESAIDVSVESLMRRMEKVNHEHPIHKWNTVIGSLYAGAWNIGGNKPEYNPYQIEAVPMEDSVSTRIIEEIAELEGVEPVDLSESLYDAIDPGALDRLFRGAPARVTFEYMGYQVTVNSEFEVRIQEIDSTEIKLN